MTLNHEFTEKIQQWLDTPHEQRDYEQGALYLLKLNGNQIMYRNLMSNPTRKGRVHRVPPSQALQLPRSGLDTRTGGSNAEAG